MSDTVFAFRKLCGGLVSRSCPILVTPWTVAHQAPLSVGFPRQEYWSGLPFPPPRDLPDLGTEPTSSAGGVFTTEPPGKPILDLRSFRESTVWPMPGCHTSRL